MKDSREEWRKSKLGLEGGHEGCKESRRKRQRNPERSKEEKMLEVDSPGGSF